MPTPRLSLLRKARLLAVSALLFAVMPAMAMEPFTADYRATYMGMQATGKMTLAPESGNRWTYSLDITGAGARLTQSTVFEANGDQWRPLSSNDAQRGERGLAAMLVKNRNSSATYDWSRGVATWSGDVNEDRAGPVRLQAGDLDGMLMNLALVRDFKSGNELAYRLVEDGRARRQVFTPAGTEMIEVQGRQQRATKVVHRDGARTITAWIVDGLPVPARLLQQRNGRDHVDLRLTALR
ncbi:DUF3108 domain-containing protein [Luteimonas aestuarii]|uniref:DUF3108 domain-containing protein n=1 Tax=Luteimonas aestuarii TaxID=453837 RepID=A0A4R5U1H0_9GAMM|nr:DUF3108 domain-containing protein [Luteimonas aestuarii]TDK27421.1 DUF3108 domain-containing protein [Luteimonas aestuarii]